MGSKAFSGIRGVRLAAALGYVRTRVGQKLTYYHENVSVSISLQQSQEATTWAGADVP